MYNIEVWILSGEKNIVSCLRMWCLESDTMGLNMPTVIYCFWKPGYVS